MTTAGKRLDASSIVVLKDGSQRTVSDSVDTLVRWLQTQLDSWQSQND